MIIWRPYICYMHLLHSEVCHCCLNADTSLYKAEQPTVDSNPWHLGTVVLPRLHHLISVVKYSTQWTMLSADACLNIKWNDIERIFLLLFSVITTEKTNILLRYLHQQWDKKVCFHIYTYVWELVGRCLITAGIFLKKGMHMSDISIGRKSVIVLLMERLWLSYWWKECDWVIDGKSDWVIDGQSMIVSLCI